MEFYNILVRVATTVCGLGLVGAAFIGSMAFVRLFILLLVLCALAYFVIAALIRKEEDTRVSFTITDPHTPFVGISSTRPGWDMNRTVRDTLQQVDITGPDDITYITVWAPLPRKA